MKYLYLFLFTFLSLPIFGQFTLDGKINVGSESAIGAEISLYTMGSDGLVGTVTDESGNFEFANLEAGSYRLVVNYLGYEKFKKRITLESNVTLEAITLVEDTYTIDGVEIKGSIIQAIQKGDTTVFNAEAFKTLPDADAKALIAKIPGIEIENGTLKANGENVQRVTVDGREFFGNDPNVALNALPAEVIQSIEIIDGQSEQSQFTGFNDGQTVKTINIITKPEKRNGEFGKLFGGYGQDDRYQAGGNMNFFNDDQRTSIIGMANNINVQNFSSDDILSVTGSSGRRGRGGRRGGGGGNFLVGQTDGISTTQAVGINFSDEWGEKVKFAGSYFFNNSDNTTLSITNQEFISTSGEGDLYTENSVVETGNMNHRFQGRFDIELNDKNSIRIRPSVSWQGNDQQEFFNSELFSALRMDTFSQNNTYLSDQAGFNIRNNIRYRHQFEKRGRTLSLSFDNTLQPNNSTSNLIDNLAGQNDEIPEQESSSDTDRVGYGAEVTFTEPIGENGQLSLEYELDTEDGIVDTETFNIFTSETNFVDNLSSDQTTNETTHQGNLSYRWRKGRDFMFIARSSVAQTNISSDQNIPLNQDVNKSFTNFLPFSMVRWQLNEESNIRIFYRTRTDNPSAAQLSETINNSNPLQLSKGNSDLNQGYIHSLFTRFSSTKKGTGRSVYVFAGADYSGNYISDQTFLNGIGNPLYEQLGISENAQLTLPENVSGYLNLRSYVTLGIPVTSLKSKLNFNLSGNYQQLPSILDNIENTTNSTTLGLGVGLTSNISEKIDFTISTKSNIGLVNNEIQPQLDQNYLNQNTTLKLNFILPHDIVFRSEVNHQLFSGFGDDFDNSYVLGVVSIGKKIFKNKRGEINVSVFDLFNQNRSISRNVSSTFIQTTESNVLQRYIMVNFRYDIRNFGKAPSRRPSSNEGRGRGFGPPGGGGRPSGGFQGRGE